MPPQPTALWLSTAQPSHTSGNLCGGLRRHTRPRQVPPRCPWQARPARPAQLVAPGLSLATRCAKRNRSEAPGLRLPRDLRAPTPAFVGAVSKRTFSGSSSAPGAYPRSLEIAPAAKMSTTPTCRVSRNEAWAALREESRIRERSGRNRPFRPLVAAPVLAYTSSMDDELETERSQLLFCDECGQDSDDDARG
jgi:hypothetical protein